MQIAQVLAGYSLGGADLLRRAMGKKIKAEMDQQQRVSASSIFGAEIRRTNKSHAAAYAVEDGLSRPLPGRSSTWSTSSPATTASTSPRGRLCAGRLPDGLSEGAPSRSSSSPRSMTLDMAQHRQAAGA
jgi:hypothetical protein